MPDEQAPRVEDTPDAPETSGSPEGTPAEAPEVNWEERYANLQPEYTRATQEASELRQLIDLARQGDPEALEFLGWQPAEDEEDEPFDAADDDDRLARLEEVVAQRLEQEAEAEQQQAFQEFVDTQLAEQLSVIENEHGQLDDEDATFLIQMAQAMPDQNGVPDLIGAYALDADRLDAKRQGWVQSKRSPQAPSGASPSSQPNLDNPEERREYMAQRLKQNEL